MAEHNAPLTDKRLARRRELTQMVVTLNGEKARIGGAKLPFAVVTQIKSGLSAEWSWEAVERIVSNGGDFKS